MDTRRVTVSELSVIGPSARNKKLAKRLCAESMLQKLGYGHCAPPNLRGVLRNSTTTDPVQINDLMPDEGAVTISKTDQGGHELHEEHKPEAPDTCKKRHIEFSLARDILVIDERFPKTPAHSYGSRLRHDRSRPRKVASDARAAVSNSSFTSKWNSIMSSSAFYNTPIGHWADSQEAHSIGRPLPVRRSRSCAEADSGRSLHFSDTQAQCNRAPSYGSLEHSETPRIVTNLNLLSHLAALCLEEYCGRHSSPEHSDSNQSDSCSLTNQLVSLCQKLHIPCQFMNRSPAYSKEQSDANYDHHTVLSIGAAALSSDVADDEVAGPQSVVARGSGSTRDLARLRAALSACRKLATVT